MNFSDNPYIPDVVKDAMPVPNAGVAYNMGRMARMPVSLAAKPIDASARVAASVLQALKSGQGTFAEGFGGSPPGAAPAAAPPAPAPAPAAPANPAMDDSSPHTGMPDYFAAPPPSAASAPAANSAEGMARKYGLSTWNDNDPRSVAYGLAPDGKSIVPIRPPTVYTKRGADGVFYASDTPATVALDEANNARDPNRMTGRNGTNGYVMNPAMTDDVRAANASLDALNAAHGGGTIRPSDYYGYPSLPLPTRASSGGKGPAISDDDYAALQRDAAEQRGARSSQISQNQLSEAALQRMFATMPHSAAESATLANAQAGLTKAQADATSAQTAAAAEKATELKQAQEHALDNTFTRTVAARLNALPANATPEQKAQARNMGNVDAAQQAINLGMDPRNSGIPEAAAGYSAAQAMLADIMNHSSQSLFGRNLGLYGGKTGDPSALDLRKFKVVPSYFSPSGFDVLNTEDDNPSVYHLPPTEQSSQLMRLLSGMRGLPERKGK